MKKFRLIPSAHRDLEEIHDYIAMDSPNAADDFIALLIDKFKLLSSQPEMGRQRPELQEGIRSLPVKTYNIYYRIIGDSVEILRVLSGYQDISRLFH
ncbi:MAG: type II toxin-antitoxin system RelE/ParE family toxin [Myxococcota bacterium]|nr:type II toxin-antitoxin system RelE/ParE family toxin [Myxococcota bacterium]